MEAKDAAQQLLKVTALRTHIESTLLFGPNVSSNQASIFDIDISGADLTDDKDRRAFFQATKDEIVHLQQRTQQAVAPIFQGIRDRCVEVEDRLLQLQAAQDSREVVMSKFASYVRTEYKIQLLTMVKLLKQLEKCTNILEIPPIVIQIATTSKLTVLEKSRMYAVLTDTVRTKKLKLLQKFHTLFEEHLDAEISSSSSSVSASSSTTEETEGGQGDVYETQKNVWRQFLERSRQWLLSYALVSISPSIVIRSHRMVVERFKEALDEAMTPLWGRFYHHLKMGRESYSRNQILWTFKYASSFIEMLHHLCAHITAADEMRLIMGPAVAAEVSIAADADASSSSPANVDFRAVAKTQVLEKALKFLNAHLASVFVLVSPWEDVFGLQLVDQILEFDTWLARYEPPSYLCHILFESKVFFHHWLLLEQSLMHRRFDPTLPLNTTTTGSTHEPTGTAMEPDEAFAKKFSTALNGTAPSQLPPPSSVSTHSSGRDRFVSVDKTTQLQCYAVLYDVLHYFLAARQRYAYFPPAAQYLLSELILEPLLCLLLGLCLYKIRCDPLLYAVSMGQASSSTLVTFLREHITVTHSETPEALRLFKDSVAYVQTALSVIDDEEVQQQTSTMITTVQQPSFIANDQRCKKRWTIVQEWLPKLLLTSDLRQQGYALRHLVKTAMKVSDKYRQHQNYAYRHQWTEHVQHHQHQHPHQHQSATASAASAMATTTLDACVTMTRGLVITMADVLDEQWQTLLAKHLSVLSTTTAPTTTPPATPAKPAATKATI